MRRGFGSRPSLDHRDPGAACLELRRRTAAVVVGALLGDALEQVRREVELLVRAAVAWNGRDHDLHRRVVVGGLHDRVDLHVLVLLESRQQIESHAQRQDESPRRLRGRVGRGAAADAAPADLVGAIDGLARPVEEADDALGAELADGQVVRRADRAGAEDDLPLDVLVLVVVGGVTAPDVHELGRHVGAAASGGERRRDVAVARDELRRAGLGDPQLRHLTVPLPGPERKPLDVDVGEPVLLRLRLGVGRLAIGAGVLLGRPVPLVGAHLHHVVQRLRAGDVLCERVERLLLDQGAGIGLLLSKDGRCGTQQQNER